MPEVIRPQALQCSFPHRADHTSRRPLTFIRLATQFDNAGDCLINRELVRLCQARSDVLLDISSCPPAFARQVSIDLPKDRVVKSKLRFYATMLFARIQRQRCYWFLIPGGIRGEGSSKRFPPHWLRDLSLFLAAASGVRICQVGASFGDLSAKALVRWRRRRKWLFRLCPRDSISAGYLESQHIFPDGLIPDLAFNLFDHDFRVLQSGRTPETAGCFSFRMNQYPRQADDTASITLHLTRQAGPSLCWRPVVQVAHDRHGMTTLCGDLQVAGIKLDPLVDLHADLEACLAFYREISFVVSNRLHVLLMAASQGARIIALTDGPGGAKIEGILRDLGLGKACFKAAEILGTSNPSTLGLHLNGRRMRDHLEHSFDELLSSHSLDPAR